MLYNLKKVFFSFTMKMKMFFEDFLLISFDTLVGHLSLTMFLNKYMLLIFKKCKMMFYSLDFWKVYSFSMLNKLMGITSYWYYRFELIGSSYKFLLDSNIIVLKLGYSHLLKFSLPNNVQMFQNKKNTLLVKSICLYVILEVAKMLKNFSSSMVYSKKGIYFFKEIVFLKSGKIWQS